MIRNLGQNRDFAARSTTGNTKRRATPRAEIGGSRIQRGLQRSLALGTNVTQQKEKPSERLVMKEYQEKSDESTCGPTTPTTVLSIGNGNNVAAVPTQAKSPSGVTSFGLQQNSPVGGLDSMNIIDESAKCMFSLMEDLRKKSLGQAGIKDSAEAVRAAGECAKRVYELMRLKLDVMKYTRGGKDGRG